MYRERSLFGEGEEVVHSHHNSRLIKIVFEDDETSRQLRREVKNVIESGIRRGAVRGAARDTPVVSIELVGTITGPEDWGQAHRLGDRPYTIVDIAVGRSESVRSNAKDILHGNHGPAELSNNLLIRQRGYGKWRWDKRGVRVNCGERETH